MKIADFLIVAMLAAVCFLTGCQVAAPSTKTTVTVVETDEGGNQKTTTTETTSESALKALLESTKGKLVMVNRQGWLAGIYFVPPGSDVTNAAGVLKLVAAKEDEQYLSVPWEAVGSAQAAKSLKELQGMIAAGRAGDINVSASGVTANTP